MSVLAMPSWLFVGVGFARQRELGTSVPDRDVRRKRRATPISDLPLPAMVALHAPRIYFYSNVWLIRTAGESAKLNSYLVAFSRLS